MADFFLLDDLAQDVADGLRRYLDGKINHPDQKPLGLSQTLANVSEAIRDAYKDNGTERVREMLLTFLWMRKEKHLQIPQTIDLLNEIPALGKDLMKVCLSVDPVTDRPISQELPRSLVVLEAVSSNGDVYTAGGPTRRTRNGRGTAKFVNEPCLLLPKPDADSTYSPLISVSSTTNSVLESLEWLTPMPLLIDKMVSHEKSSIVGVIPIVRSTNSYLRFLCPADASHYIQRYRNARALIKHSKQRPSQLEHDLRAAHDHATGVAKAEPGWGS